MLVCMHRPAWWNRLWQQMIWGRGERYRNLYAHTVWAVIEKQTVAGESGSM